MRRKNIVININQVPETMQTMRRDLYFIDIDVYEYEWGYELVNQESRYVGKTDNVTDIVSKVTNEIYGEF